MAEVVVKVQVEVEVAVMIPVVVLLRSPRLRGWYVDPVAQIVCLSIKMGHVFNSHFSNTFLTNHSCVIPKMLWEFSQLHLSKGGRQQKEGFDRWFLD